MKTLVIRQPWAWSIIHCGKDIENRSWNTKFRGRFLVAAAKTMAKNEYTLWWDFVMIRRIYNVSPPEDGDLLFGGIIGSVELYDANQTASSKWYEGPFGFQLRKPKALAFTPLKGRLGFFDYPDIVEGN